MASSALDRDWLFDDVDPTNQGDSDVARNPLSELVSREIEAMASADSAAGRARVERFLADHPDLPPEIAVRLIYEETSIRRDAGEDLPSAEVLARHPQWRSKLALLLDCDRLLRVEEPVDFPSPGEDLGDFRLLCEIGRGAQGRTFLARQRSLAERRVVLKVGPLGHDEHLSLARLQHMHIVPLYFEHVFPDRGMRVLGMPYLGGATLARLIELLAPIAPCERTGADVVAALDAETERLTGDAPAAGPFRDFLRRSSYVEAVAGIAACLAEALHYAHERGLVHMDVKPSNVLIAGDGQPMLLDFHLARAPIAPTDEPPERLGGTPELMAPEQLAAMRAIRDGRRVDSAVDGRADVYSLGILIDELLSGESARDPSAPRRKLSCRNPAVSTGLSDVVACCLEPSPGSRYRSAAALRDDLMRHLNHMPLRGVSNRDLWETWRKWRRRRPATLGFLLIFLAILTIAGPFGAIRYLGLRAERASDEATVLAARAALSQRKYTEARSLLASRVGPDAPHPPSPDVASLWRQVVREQATADFHAFVDLLRFRYGLQFPPAAEARALAERIEDIWDRRALVRRDDESTFAADLDPEAEERLRADLLDLATIRAHLRLEARSDGNRRAAVGEAIEILESAREEFGASPALARDLNRYRAELGDRPTLTEPAAHEPPRTAWEHFQLGRSYFRSDDFAAAEEEFAAAARLQPGEFWPHFFQGLCASHGDRHRDAAWHFSIGIALAPRSAEAYYNRALSFMALNDPSSAAADFAQARALNPNLTTPADHRTLTKVGR